MTAGQEARGHASTALQRLIAGLGDDDRIAIGDVTRRLGSKSFGLALIGLALPAMIPIPGPFGMVTGLCLVLVAWQMLSGRRRLILPSFVADGHITVSGLRQVIERAVPWLHRLEAVMRQDRWRSLTGKASRVLMGAPVLVLAVVLALPIPFGNIGPVISLIVIGLSLMTRDGLALMVGLGLTLATVAWTAVLFFAGAQIAGYLGGLFA